MAYTRITVAGSRKRADLVLPDDAPVGSLAPQILDVLDEAVEGGLDVGFVDSAGTMLEHEGTLKEQSVPQGAVFRVVTLDDAPASPDVADVTLTLGDTARTRTDAWGTSATRIALVLLTGISTLVGTSYVLAASLIGVLAMLGGVALVTALGVVASRRSAGSAASVFAALALGAMPPIASSILVEGRWPAMASLVVLGWWAILGLILGVGGSSRPVGLGALVGVVTSALLSVGLALDVAPALLCGILAFICVAALGLLPGVAMSISGLTRYDDLTIGGQSGDRVEVLTAIRDAYSALTWTVVALAIPISYCLHALLGASAWESGLAVSLTAVVLLRARIFPLIPQRIALFLAVLVPWSVWFVSTTAISDGQKAAACFVLAVLWGVLTVVRVPKVTGARMRRYASTLELLAVLATVPCLLGALGIFDDLFAVLR
ncbi:hypothetical protein DEO23_12135 [Brachybacterium endophyticum]|uniref:EccD-like transmembrane domain-containing protein n=1 Tax=Brachybacterium endophyticum TaxID=2182385 RepID=A0A2U2RHJ5_9MICO|nr:EsaB/YukD family protein [Brachybacterium endophyticum]PWH05337.1 hypothetical protein DEO23_12135 [Brachybacterium endophyticum]